MSRSSPSAGSAWETLRAMKAHFGDSRVSDELYAWFTHDAGTLGYGYMGTLRLLGKPEKEALRVMRNATRRLAGRKTALEWRDFVKQNEPTLPTEGAAKDS